MDLFFAFTNTWFFEGIHKVSSLVFCRKDLYEAKHETQNVFKVSDILLALKLDGPPEVISHDQVWKYFRSGWCLVKCTPLVATSHDQVWNCFRAGWPLVRCTPCSDISWPSLELLQVRLTLGQTSPTLEASGGQVLYYFRQADLWSDEPPWERHHIAMICTTFVRWTPQVQTSLGQVWYYFKQADLLPDVSPIKTSHGKFGTTLSRLIFGQMDSTPAPVPFPHPSPKPLVETSHGQVWYLFIWTDLLVFRLFSIAFPISDDKSSSSKVVPWCSNTSHWWSKDVSKLVWREQSSYTSLHCVQEYVIRQHGYKTVNCPWM